MVLSCAPNACSIEMVVPCKAVKFGRDMEIQNISLDGTWSMHWKLHITEGQSHSLYENLIDDLKTMVHNLQSRYMKHVIREANIATHYLAKAASNNLQSKFE